MGSARVGPAGSGTSQPVPRIRTLVLILAGGAGGRLELLTHSRAKPAVPFAGTHRLIDFPLSNCLHAGISERATTTERASSEAPPTRCGATPS